MKRIFGTLCTMVLLTKICFAYDFSGKTDSLGNTVKRDSLLECHSIQLHQLKQNHTLLQWALDNGIAIESRISKTLGYSDTITTKNSLGKKVLLIGCWITNEVVSEMVNGKPKYYARGEYKISDLVKNSPIIQMRTCKIRKETQIFIKGDFQLLPDKGAECRKDRVPISIEQINRDERKEILFELKRNIRDTGYVRSIRWGPDSLL